MTDALSWNARFAPSLDDFHALAEHAWSQMPDAIKRAAGAVVFRIQDFAEDEVLADLGIEDPFELTGLYQGVDLTLQSDFGGAPNTPMVFLYREPILDEWITRGDVGLGELVAHVVIHEVGHHFGFSDEGMDQILDED